MDMAGSRCGGVDAVTLSVTGMTCSGCANAVKRALSRVLGVAHADVDLENSRATVQGGARPEDLVAAVQAAGYGAWLLEGSRRAE